MIDNVHRVKRKNDIGKISYLIFLLAFDVYVIVINIRYEEPLLLYILLMSTFTFGFVFFAYKLFCFLRYSFTYYPFRIVELELLPGSFRLDHCTIQATEIDVILIVITAYILLIGYEIYYYFTYNRASKKRFLIIDEDRLILHNQVVLPTQIDLIISEGFIHSSIGIKLTNHRWIPQRLQFLFADQHTEQEAFDQLQEWAAKYQIEIRDGKVRSLL